MRQPVDEIIRIDAKITTDQESKLAQAWLEYVKAKIRYEKMLDMYIHGKPVEWCEVSFEKDQFADVGNMVPKT